MPRLTEQQIREILLNYDRWAALSTIGRDGFPHTVPVGYFLLHDTIVIGCRDGSQKVKNIERNERVSLLWENGRGFDTLTGIMIKGRARVVREREQRQAIKALIAALKGEEAPAELSPGGVYLEISPERTVSWNRPARRSRSISREKR